MDVHEVRPRKDRRGVDLISDALPFRGLWYGRPNAITNAVDYAKFRSRSHHAVVSVYEVRWTEKRSREDYGMTTKRYLLDWRQNRAKKTKSLNSCATGRAWLHKSPQQPPGSAFDLAKPPSPSSTHFRMMPDVTRICQETLPRR